MSQQPTEAPAKKFKQKNWAVINGSCKMAKLSDGRISRLNGVKGIPLGVDAEDEDAAFLEQVYVLDKLFAYVDRAYDKHLDTLPDCAKPLARWRYGMDQDEDLREAAQ